MEEHARRQQPPTHPRQSENPGDEGSDQTQADLARFVASLSYEDLPANVVHEVKRRLIDSLGCAVGALSSEPVRMMRRMAAKRQTQEGATILGSDDTFPPEFAAFANAVAMRYLDFNDRFIGGHPSDYIAGALSAGEIAKADGRQLLTAVLAAYEVFCSLGPINFRRYGWDQGTIGVIAAACGACKALDLNQTQTEEAIAIASASNVSLRQIRTGPLSMWKGAAGPYATQAGTMSALLAAEGATGPNLPFHGEYGFWRQLIGDERKPDVPGDKDYAILRADFKYWPVEFNTQLAVWMGRTIREQVSPQHVTKIVVGTYDLALTEVADPAKWHPTNRETADHSLPYILTLALRKGDVELEDFEERSFSDPENLELMERISVVENPHFSEVWPAKFLMSADVHTRDGNVLAFQLDEPKGRYSNPMSDAEVEAKFRKLTSYALGENEEAASRLLEALWHFDDHDARTLFTTISDTLRKN